jgi:hypothetical protein
MSVPSSKSTVMSASAYFVVDRDGDALLDLFGGEARRLHDDLYLHRRDIRKGVDRQAGQEDGAGADHQQHAQQDEEPL